MDGQTAAHDRMARSYDDLMGCSGEPVGGRIESDGVGVAWLDWGGFGDALVLLHPNGFCAGVYDPVARRLASGHRVIGIDLRGHGDSDDGCRSLVRGGGGRRDGRCGARSGHGAGAL